MNSVLRTQKYEFLKIYSKLEVDSLEKYKNPNKRVKPLPNMSQHLSHFSAQCTIEARVLEIIRKIPRMLKKVPKSDYACFEHVLSRFFLKNIFALCTMGGEDLQIFFKKSIFFQKSRKARKLSEKCSNMFGTCFEVFFFRSFFCLVHYGGLRLRKRRNFFRLSKMPKNFPKLFKRVSNISLR